MMKKFSKSQARNHPSHRDKNHDEVVKAMRNRMGGYFRDQNGGHHAHLLGLNIDAYDFYKVGSGFPDWIVYVSWLAVTIEIKNPERTLSKKDSKTFIQGRFTDEEKLFMQNFHGIRRTMFEQNEIYDFLYVTAKFVMHVDDLMTGEPHPELLPLDYVKLFFPKAALNGTVETKETL